MTISVWCTYVVSEILTPSDGHEAPACVSTGTVSGLFVHIDFNYASCDVDTVTH